MNTDKLKAAQEELDVYEKRKEDLKKEINSIKAELKNIGKKIDSQKEYIDSLNGNTESKKG